MVDLRPLLVITGTLRVEGGERTKTASKVSGDGHKVKTTIVRDVTDDRRSANVIATNYIRRLRKLIIMRTPYGTLADKNNFDLIRAMIDAASAPNSSIALSITFLGNPRPLSSPKRSILDRSVFSDFFRNSEASRAFASENLGIVTDTS